MPICPYCKTKMSLSSRKVKISVTRKVSKFQYVCHNCFSRGPLADNESEANIKTVSPTIFQEIENIAKDKNFELSDNADKIIKAKLRMFGEEDWRRCPCSSDDIDRFCGSEKCELDTYNNNHCHCNLFLFKAK